MPPGREIEQGMGRECGGGERERKHQVACTALLMRWRLCRDLSETYGKSIPGRRQSRCVVCGLSMIGVGLRNSKEAGVAERRQALGETDRATGGAGGKGVWP